MKSCGFCGQAIPDEVVFCTYCGKKVVAVENALPKSQDRPEHKAIVEAPNSLEKSNNTSVNKILSKSSFVAALILCLMVGVTVYYSNQINLYEQAMVGKVNLNNPGDSDFASYEKKNEQLRKTIIDYKLNNPELMKVLAEYKKLNLQEPKDPYAGLDLNIKTKYIGDPDFIISYAVAERLKQENPNHYQTYMSIINDLNSKVPRKPSSGNPPKTQIEQTIKSLQRDMYTIDGILILCLLVFFGLESFKRTRQAKY